MPLIQADRVKETTTSTSTGSVTLLGAASGFQTFSAGIGDGNTCYYTIALPGSSEWEVGIGTYTSSGNTLSRDTVLSSSNSGSLVSFSAGTKDVFVTYPASRSALGAANQSMVTNNTTINTSYTLPSGQNAMSVGPITIASGFAVTVSSGQRWVVI